MVKPDGIQRGLVSYFASRFLGKFCILELCGAFECDRITLSWLTLCIDVLRLEKSSLVLRRRDLN